jgi:hypothetical protein
MFISARRATALCLSVAAAGAALTSAPAQAASSKSCDGGGFRVVAPGKTLAGDVKNATIPASALTGTVHVVGRYQTFDVDPATLSVYHFTFTGTANQLSLTGGRTIEAFAAKTADLRGQTLTGPLTVTLDKETYSLSRAGTGVSMTLTGKDCAAGGIFQMEPESADGQPTVITHVLGDGTFYFDNPNFRAHLGEVLNGTTVTTRVNFANDAAPAFVGRDSTQLATRLSQFGKVSTWSVASGGRMGQVMGEDAVSVEPAATACSHQCHAGNQVQGAAAVLGFPSPVPAASRLTPDFPAA